MRNLLLINLAFPVLRNFKHHRSLYKSDTDMLELKSKYFVNLLSILFLSGLNLLLFWRAGNQIKNQISNRFGSVPANLYFCKPRQKAHLIFKMPQA